MNNNGYNYNNPNNHVNYPEEKQYNNYYSQRNGKNYYNNMNINKGGYIYKNYSTPKMMIQGQKDNFSPDPKKMPYQNYNKKLNNKENNEDFSNQNIQRHSSFNDVCVPIKKNYYRTNNNYNNNNNKNNHRQKSANTLNTINF